MWCDTQFAKFDERLRLDESRGSRIASAVDRFVSLCQQDEQLRSALAETPFLQGSVPTHTVIRPIGNDEYDVDVIYPFRLDVFNAADRTPARLFPWFVGRLQGDGWYKGRMTVKNRCVRINYAGDFHMDIIPSTRGVPQHQPYAVPTRDLKTWVTNDPHGMASWLKLRDTASGMVDARGDGALVRSIRAAKRWRDHFFGTDERVSSLLLVTVLAKHEASRRDYNPPLADPLYPTNRNQVAYLFDLMRLTQSCLQEDRVEAYLHPTILGEDLRRGWDPTFRQLFLNRLAACIKNLRAGIEATSETQAVAAYRAALGATFPA